MKNDWLSLTEIPLLSPKIPEPIWQRVLYALSHPPDSQVSQFGLIVHRYRWLVLVELIRNKWDSKFCKGQIKHKDKKGAELEGELWRRVLDLISEIYSLEGGCLHPALWFHQVFNEYSLGVTIQVCDFKTKTELFAEIRHQNRALQTLSEDLDSLRLPFEGEATQLFLRLAMKHANTKDRFRTQYYTPFVKSRMALTTWRADDSILSKKQESGKGLISRQGRRKAAEL